MKEILDKARKIASTALTGIFVTIVVSVLLWFPVSHPIVKIVDSFILILTVIKIVFDLFAAELQKVNKWVKALVVIAVAVIAFITLLFLIAQVFQVYPGDAYDAWWNGHGFDGIFWGHQAPGSITAEILLIGLLGWIMWAFLRGRGFSKFLAGVVTTIGVAILAIGIIFPGYAATWPKKKAEVEQSLETKGLLNTIFPHEVAAQTAPQTVSVNVVTTNQPMQPTMPIVTNNVPVGPQAVICDPDYPTYNCDPTAISPNVYAVTVNNHANQNYLLAFDVVMTGDIGPGEKVGQFGKEGFVAVPKSWHDFRKYWLSNEPGQHVGYLYQGSAEQLGPFGVLPPVDDPRFKYKPGTWLVQGKGVLRYEKID